MRLADFILNNTESILSEWETFARRIWPRATGDPVELRDHAQDILRAVARDMASRQTSGQRSDKSKGVHRDDADGGRLDDASVHHGSGRVASGFKLKQVVAEYRALRASVIHLWRASRPEPDALDIDDLTRFNEAIDQSLTMAVESFTDRVDRSRELFLAILGHDLRAPLSALVMSADVLARDAHADSEMAAVITRSANAMSRMMADLLDFTGAGLGGGLPLTPEPTDLARICDEVVRETRAAHPDCTVDYHAAGNLSGKWDAARLRQVVSNLLGNAVQHGAEACTVRIDVRGNAAGAGDVTLTVHNGGSPIPPAAMSTIFDPLVRVTSPEVQRRRRPGSIGLGLFIVREIVTAHGGTITVTSTAAEGTAFTVHLPRAAGAAGEGRAAGR
jgi:signal transduction histidine kinase